MDRQEQNVLTIEKIRIIIGYISTYGYKYGIERNRDLFYIDLLRHIGARPCEIRGLKVGCIRKDDNGEWGLILNGRKQKGRIRSYSIPSCLVESYLNYMRERARYNPSFDDLFISRAGKPLTHYGMQQIFRRISRGVGFRVNAYGFRRFVATNLDAKGTSMKEIARYLGHTKISTTELYIQRSKTLTKNASKTMAEVNSMNASQQT